MHTAYFELRFEGKPQCHIIAIAKESGVPAASTGCAPSRQHTSMSDSEITFAVRGGEITLQSRVSEGTIVTVVLPAERVVGTAMDRRDGNDGSSMRLATG